MNRYFLLFLNGIKYYAVYLAGGKWWKLWKMVGVLVKIWKRVSWKIEAVLANITQHFFVVFFLLENATCSWSVLHNKGFFIPGKL